MEGGPAMTWQPALLGISALIVGCATMRVPELITLTAERDLVIYQRNNLAFSPIVGRLSAGTKATVLGCEIVTSEVAVRIRTAEGLTGYVNAPGLQLLRRPSPPNAPGAVTTCRGLFDPVSEYQK
jgi:hypothetical protein